MTNAHTDRDWNSKYDVGDTPWDSGLPSRELLRVLNEQDIASGRALELGCGTGTNAIALAARGFEVTAVDCSPLALAEASQKATAAGVSIEWIEADVQNFGEGLIPFDLVFDRGCYHCCRRVDLSGYLQTLDHVTADGSHVLILAGNANEQTEFGPPRVTEKELRSELGGLFEVVTIREFRFQDPADGKNGDGDGVGVDGPLGWSTLLIRASFKPGFSIQ